MNPIISSCFEIMRAGYERNPRIPVWYKSDTLFSLAKYLLADYVRVQELDYATEPRRVACCFGAGVDSYCAVIHALKQNRPVCVLFVNYGHPANAAEARVYNALLDAHKGKDSVFSSDLNRFPDRDMQFEIEDIEGVIPDASDLKWKDYIVPARNLVFSAIASQYARTIWIVATARLNENVGTRDKTSRFYRLTSTLLSEFYGTKYVVESPFFDMTKLQVVKAYLDDGGDKLALTHTYSCYAGTCVPCGECYACFKRYNLFQKLDIEYTFNVHPVQAKNYNQYVAKELAKRGSSF